jgi:hypothetical protein
MRRLKAYAVPHLGLRVEAHSRAVDRGEVAERVRREEDAAARTPGLELGEEEVEEEAARWAAPRG